MIDFSNPKTRQESKCRRITYRHYCDKCNCDLGYRRNKKNWSGMCRSCFNKNEHTGRVVTQETKSKMSKQHYLKKGGIHPLQGKKHSEATKLKLSKKQTEYCKNNQNQFKGHSHSIEAIGKISRGNSGKEPKWKGRTFQYNGPKGFFKMRSSYELLYANWMDDQGINWTYEVQFKLSNNKIFSPDFQLSNGDIIEIKGYWTKIGLEKWTNFCLDYPNINKTVLMKQDLLKLGLGAK